MPSSLVSDATYPLSATAYVDNLEKYFLVVGDADYNTLAYYVLNAYGTPSSPEVCTNSSLS